MLSTAKWTIEDYHRIVASGVLAGRRVELIYGDIVEMVPEGEPHAYTSDEAGEYLTYLLGNRAKVRQGKPITILQSDSEPEPDIAVVRRLGQEYREHHPYPENVFWLIEYADSSLTKDLNIKPQVYAAAGILEYWVVDLRKRELMIWRSPTPEGYQAQQRLKQGTINPLAFPDLDIDVERILYG
jgi:Uma2 family endonuclease